MRLVLASASPRRRSLIALLGLESRVAPTQIDEDAHLTGEALVAAVKVANAKLAAVPALAADECAVAADTLVVLDGRMLAKPADPDEARAMLRSLRARSHDVLTGVALSGAGQPWVAVVSTRVAMRAYSDTEIEAYIARGEPFDKAGAYAIQDQLFKPVSDVEGCYLNVVGLPLCAVAAGLRTLGASVDAADSPPCHYCRAGASLVSISI